MATLFTEIIQRKLPAEIVFENDAVIAFKDIHPKAPIHLLIVTKKEIPSLQALTVADYPLLGEIVAVAQKLARDLGLEEGYRLITNVGRDAGQTVHHLHFHLLGGRELDVMG